MSQELATQPVASSQITLPVGKAITNKNGKALRTEFSFLPKGVSSAAALRKHFRDKEGMTNAQARLAANAAVSGDAGKMQSLMAVAFVQDSLDNGFMPVKGAESTKGDKRTLSFERKDIGAQVKDAADKAKKAAADAKQASIEQAVATLKAAGVDEAIIATTVAAMQS